MSEFRPSQGCPLQEGGEELKIWGRLNKKRMRKGLIAERQTVQMLRSMRVGNKIAKREAEKTHTHKKTRSKKRMLGEKGLNCAWKQQKLFRKKVIL